MKQRLKVSFLGKLSVIYMKIFYKFYKETAELFIKEIILEDIDSVSLLLKDMKTKDKTLKYVNELIGILEKDLTELKGFDTDNLTKYQVVYYTKHQTKMYIKHDKYVGKILKNI